MSKSAPQSRAEARRSGRRGEAEADVSAAAFASARERLIVALDVANAADARRLSQALGSSVGWLKVGKQLFTAEGPQLVRELTGTRQVFLDLKFHDIPNTVAGAVRSAATLGVGMITVHASGGQAMLRAAVEAAAGASKPPMVLAVTVLTSLGDDDLEQIGIAGRVENQVLRLAALARAARCGGIVASAREAGLIRRELGEGFAIVTPGIRPVGSASKDQARVDTPEAAIKAGATHIVVGRPITEAGNPREAAEGIVAEISRASRG